MMQSASPRTLARWIDAVPVSAWMTRDVVTIGPNASVAEAAARLAASGVRHLPVVDESGRLLGILTDRDVRQFVLAPHLLDQLDRADVLSVPVREAMTWSVVTVRPETDLRAAARLMYERRIGALLVVDDRRLVGLLSETDLLRALESVLGERIRPLRPLSAAPGRVSADEDEP